MARQENLTVIREGLSRQRIKGAALKDTLFDLLNGFVTTQKTVKVRPGTLLTETLTAGTKGLVHFDGGFHVFASSSVAVPSGYTLHIIKSPDDESLAIKRIHFAEPFMGALYVSAEFTDSRTYHYWLQPAATWVADTDYKLNETVEPTTPNGLVYKARRQRGAFPAWTANTFRFVNDIVEPTTENNFKYTVTQVIGSTARSVDVEPIWPLESGAIIVEDIDDQVTPLPIVGPTPTIGDDRFIDDDRTDRYANRSGGGGESSTDE